MCIDHQLSQNKIASLDALRVLSELSRKYGKWEWMAIAMQIDDRVSRAHAPLRNAHVSHGLSETASVGNAAGHIHDAAMRSPSPTPTPHVCNKQKTVSFPPSFLNYATCPILHIPHIPHF